MKTLKWFKAGESIPDDAKYLMVKEFPISVEEEMSDDGSPYINVEDFYLYEVPVKEEKEEKEEI